ncbi:hypothetical protein [uncultured Sphingorhabdus sp.]|jgi:hypothetical protein|uniref:hypothetical protein n=1 Tax=uncultured Sphingorhabdus sp. TaxID=1686106 RepID=UPI002612C154|nr:hypothetical protein [uncultured Sphingorhabdus sp.]
MTAAFDPADAAAWIAHGRPPALARSLADVWRRHPDLPASSPADARLARMRDRAAALRPVIDAMRTVTKAERHVRNFAFTAAQFGEGKAGPREAAILRGRDLHGYDWDLAVRYASGWYAADAGWDPEVHRPGNRSAANAAYDRGFGDGGGNRDDPFDTARRALSATGVPGPRRPPAPARPRPSDWPQPTDAALPVRWARRLLIFGAPEIGIAGDRAKTPISSAVLLPALVAAAGHEDALVIVISGDGFIPLPDAMAGLTPLSAGAFAKLAADTGQAANLRGLLEGREFDDILVAAQGPYLALLDAHASAIPLCRTMARTRNSVLLQKAQFRTWIGRGIAAGQSVGAGHIRWGKAIKGLTGRLGEFTARYTGKVPGRGHRIIVEVAASAPASGYATATGEPLEWEWFISNRAQLRAAMAARLSGTRNMTSCSSSSATPPASIPMNPNAPRASMFRLPDAGGSVARDEPGKGRGFDGDAADEAGPRRSQHGNCPFLRHRGRQMVGPHRFPFARRAQSPARAADGGTPHLPFERGPKRGRSVAPAGGRLFFG